MKVVLDTNIYISGLLWPKSLPGTVLELAKAEKIDVYISPFIIVEIEKVLIAKFHFEAQATGMLVGEIVKFAKIVETEKELKIIKDKDDNRVLECALVVKADFLISGDKKHILPLKQFRGIKIISAREFLNEYLEK